MANFYKPINFSPKKCYFKHIAQNSYFLCHVCPLTIETHFYLDSKPEEITEKVLKSPKVLSRSMLDMAYWIPSGLEKLVKQSPSMLHVIVMPTRI